MQKKIQKPEKVHYLNYLAFLPVLAHALLAGSDFKAETMRILELVVAVTATGIFIHIRGQAQSMNSARIKTVKIKNLEL